MPDSFRMTRLARLGSLRDVRAFLQEHCSAVPGVNPDILYAIELAVDEACTNVISHGYAGMDPGPIEVDLELAPGKIIISLTDFGHAFDPSRVPPPDTSAPIEDRRPGGLGLHFIHQCVDRMEYRTSKEGNTMILTKYLLRKTGGNE